ncbi:unnamed protein product [Chrysodeixis includens]|uniref:Nanos-type domain-containing protein n=1 Tax=Chrysodeixis includens TaxID=689277 RepID=A0A9P0BVP1_CHRIL|nr:unnamed protein product [Chrysodeixis includens]
MCSITGTKMYPTKSAFDYMTEMNRLFPRNAERDAYNTRNASTDGFRSPFQQTTAFNRSSSSADSLSPESFPDLHERQAFETPIPMTVRRQRPIVGRKIFDNPERVPPTLEPTRLTQDMFQHTWQPDDHSLYPPTPPSLEQTKCPPNIFYELFPTENKGFEFKAPITPVSPGPNYRSPNYSPTFASSSPISAKTPYLPTSPFKLPMQTQNYGPGSSKYQESKSTKMCTFCRKNGETPLVYMTHTVKEKVGHQNIVTCPILRSHVCSTCGASGDNAHTITYCPILRSNNNGQPLQSTTITLKNTRIKSNGRRRY